MQGATEGVGRKRLLAFGAALGLPVRAIESSLDEVLAATEPVLDDLASGVLPWNANLRRTVVRQLARRRADVLG